MGKDCRDSIDDSIRGDRMAISKISIQPRKQRRGLYNAPLHKRRIIMSSHLSDELEETYGIRSYPVRKGDTVKIMRGSHKGATGKVASIDRKNYFITVDGVTMTKADGKEVARKIHPSNVMITQLDLSDPKRKKYFDEKKAEVERAEKKRKAKKAKKTEEKKEESK